MTTLTVRLWLALAKIWLAVSAIGIAATNFSNRQARQAHMRARAVLDGMLP